MKLKPLLKPLALTGVLLALFVSVLAVPNIQRAWVRNKVADRTFEVKGKRNGGGGTGFQVEAASGTSYIITNSHVCEMAQADGKDENFLLVNRHDHWMKRRILEVSRDSDLCLVEGWPGLQGLSIGGRVHIGQTVSAIGHPHLGPITMSSGEVVAFTDTLIEHHIMLSGDKKLNKLLGASDMACDMPKNEIVKKHIMFFGLIDLGEVPFCMVRESKAIQTNVTIFGGNSGSPLVDSWGRVVGIVFASDPSTNWGYAVNLRHLNLLLKDF